MAITEETHRARRARTGLSLALIAVVVLLAAVSAVATDESGLSGAPVVPPGNATAIPGCVVPKSVRIAVIGDYGACTLHPVYCEAEAAVAYFVREANPEFVVTVGDNDYLHGEGGPYRHPPPYGPEPVHIANDSRVYRLDDFPEPHSTLPPPQPTGTPAELAFPPIPPTFPPTPTVSSGVELYEYFLDSGRFFIALGNHDWHQEHALPNKLYFDQQGKGENHPTGLVEVISVDSNEVAARATDEDEDVTNPPQLLPQAKSSAAFSINRRPAGSSCTCTTLPTRSGRVLI